MGIQNPLDKVKCPVCGHEFEYNKIREMERIFKNINEELIQKIEKLKEVKK